MNDTRLRKRCSNCGRIFIVPPRLRDFVVCASSDQDKRYAHQIGGRIALAAQRWPQ